MSYHGVMAGSVVQDSFVAQLNATHRCDRCGAQAYVRASCEGWAEELLFCAHHGRESVPSLMKIDGVWVHDETDRLYDDAQRVTTEV